jgi:molecular chaperone Hsp33
MTQPVPATPDRLTRFLLDAAGVRGVHVALAPTWAEIRGRAEYPAPVATLLGEAVAAAALFTGHAKVEGRLSVQLRGSGALRTLFAECTAAGTLRGIATLAEGADAPSTGELPDLAGSGGVLAITIENPGLRSDEPARYQGLVALEAATLSAAFEGYFAQSEQLPTRLLLVADGDRAAGLMLQKLPGDSGDADGWDRVGALFETLGADELRDTPVKLLLHRLFHEDGVRLLAEKPLAFGCSCSRERVAGMLVGLGLEEARAAAADNGGTAEIHCEFCGQTYRFEDVQIEALFLDGAHAVAGPERLQ